MAMLGGTFSGTVADWHARVLGLSAALELVLDFADEDDAHDRLSEGGLPAQFASGCIKLAGELEVWLARPRAEPLRDGFRVVLAGPPNTGKSTLFNVLVDDEAAITAPEPGTTRDVLVRSVAMSGVPFTFVDTAGLRDEGAGAIERAPIGCYGLGPRAKARARVRSGISHHSAIATMPR